MHALRQRFHMVNAVRGGVHQFEIPVGVGLSGRFVGNDLDARITRPLQHRLQHFRVVRHHADDVCFLRDKILNRTDLQGRIGGSRAHLPGVNAAFRRFAFNACFHSVKPGDAADFDHDAHA